MPAGQVMQSIWKVVASGVCAGIIVAAIAWPIHKSRVAVEKLIQEAQLTRAAAERGNPEAEVSLGSKYFHGESVPQNYTEALHWFKKAADQGDASGQYHLGVMYYYGHAVPQDYGEAIRLFLIAAGQGYPTAADQLGTMALEGIGRPRDETETYRWYRLAAERGYARGEEHLGTMYFYGRGVVRDRAQALHWYRKAAEQGDAGAEYDLGAMYFTGQGVPRNLVEGRTWLRKAAAQREERALRAITIGLATEEKMGLGLRVGLGLVFALSVLSFNSAVASNRPEGFRLKTKVLIGGLTLLSTGYDWYGYTRAKILSPVFGLDAFTALHWILDSAVIALLVYYLLYVVQLGKKADARRQVTT